MSGSAPDIRRRDFLVRGVKGMAAIAVSGGIGYYLGWPARGAGRPRQPAAEFFHLPDFSLPGLKGRMSIVRGADRVLGLRRGIEAVGGWSSFISRGDRVLLKVNAAFASVPILGATTHPDLVHETAAQCFKAGAASVVVTDNPIHDAEACFELTGIRAAALAAGADLLLPRPEFFRPCHLPGAGLLSGWPVLAQPFAGINRLIGLAPVKSHHRSGASLSLKNWYGLLGGHRAVFHQDIHRLIAELARWVRPTLVILDGTSAMVSNGPTGGSLSDLKPTHTMIVSADPVAADACGAELLGRRPASLPFLMQAAAAGLGTASYELLDPVRLNSGAP